MPRVKRGTKRRAKRKKILDRASGYFLTKSKLYRSAKEAVERGLKFAYSGRKQRKRQFRSLWIVRIGAAAKLNGMSYNTFIHGLKKAGVELDRKILADLAVKDAAAFKSLAEQAKALSAGRRSQPSALSTWQLSIPQLRIVILSEWLRRGAGQPRSRRTPRCERDQGYGKAFAPSLGWGCENSLNRHCGNSRTRGPSTALPALRAGNFAQDDRVLIMSPKKKSAYTVPKLKDFSATALDKEVAKLLAAVEEESKSVNSEDEWKVFRDRWIARKNGILTEVNDLWLKAAPKEAKRDVGQRVNTSIIAHVETIVKDTHDRWKNLAISKKARAENVDAQIDEARLALELFQRVDITLPGNRRRLGAEHPVIKTMNEIVRVFRNLGYSVEEGPEIETDYYNFEALNFPPNHPARDTQDTLFIANQESKTAAGAVAAAHAHFAGADPHHGKDEASGARGLSGESPSQRRAGRYALSDLSSGRRAGSGYEHYVLRFEGDARSCHEGAVWIEREDAVLSVVLPFHRTQRGCADQLHFLRRAGLSRRRSLPELQSQRLD